MAKGDPQEFHIQIRLPDRGFRKVMFFNRFRVEREDGFCVIYFGHLGNSGLLVDSYCCVLPADTLQNSEKALLTYLTQVGHAKGAAPEFQGFASKDTQSGVADLISMARRGEIGETGFGMFSMITGTQLSPASEGKVFDAEPMILLRSSVEMQRQLISALYAQ